MDNNTGIEWLSPQQLENEFGINKNHQAGLRMHRKIPYSKIGKMIKYSRTKINQWLNDADIKNTDVKKKEC